MRNNQERWQFYDHPSRPALDASSVRYWKELLKKLLKVGLEFEFNLQDQKNKCKGDNLQCPCIHLDEGCWQECRYIDTCKEEKSIETCANRKASCKPKDCKDCKNYKFQCLGIVCSNFVSKCFSCTKFEKNCETCERRYDPKKDPQKIRHLLEKEFKPTKNYSIVGPNGIVGITTDGSLLGDHGVEIITVGRRVDFWEFYKMSKKIIDRSVSLGGWVNERCGAHAHLLTSYYDDRSVNEMEKDMPELILANFHQLCRRYQNAITWMTSALDDPNYMTRWEKYRVSILDISPVTDKMSKVVDDISANSGGTKYGWANYNRVKFSRNGDVHTFHVEMRVADATLCPSVWASIACMYYALVIKAVEISRYGLLKVGNESWLNKAKAAKKALLNNCKEWNRDDRFSHTEKVLEFRSQYQEESLDLLNQLKGILLKLGPAYEILTKLAEQPVALRRINGDKWHEIENNLKVEMAPTNQIELKINELIDLRLIDDCKTSTEWIKEAKIAINNDEEVEAKVSESDVESFIDIKMREGEVIWSNSIGTMVSV